MVHDWSKPVDGHPRLFDHSAGTPHHRPSAGRRVGVFVAGAPIAVIRLLAGRAIGGAGAYPFLGGFALGYLAYDLIHYSIHRSDTKSGVLNWLRRYHFQHHFAATDRQFGVSTPIWDYVFPTGR